jgi:SAM-dependent methyltransferase
MPMTDPLGTSFHRAADAYARARPSYPAEAVAWMLPASARLVADVGAGTGKLTQVIAATGRDVIAVDPDAGMLERLRAVVPGARTEVGSAERLPLADASVDAVTFGQAWHWVDEEAASAEAARVLRPGGTLALIWNIRDTRVDWVAELMTLIDPSNAELFIDAGGPHPGASFGPVETAEFRWDNPLDVDGLVDLVASRSMTIAATEDERAETLARVRALGERIAARDGRILLPYVTHAYRTTASDAAPGS